MGVPPDVAAAARLADDRRGPMYRGDAGDLHDAIRSAHSALDTPAEPAHELQAQGGLTAVRASP
jgi:hypothetical protein